MSKKRISAGSDEQANEGSDFVLQREDNAKHAKLTSSNDTMLQDLPIEMLERIFVQAVVMEVKDMKMAKSVWKDKAGLVISRLITVCSQWSSILTTDFFRNEVNRVIDGTDQEACRLEIFLKYPLPFKVSKVATHKEEIFLLCTHDAQGDLDRVINVYNRTNLAEVKDVILLPRRNAKALEACLVSDCLYVLFADSPGISMFRLTRDEEHHQFNISPWISDYKLSYDNLYVSANGNVVITSDLQHSSDDVLISIYDANGFFQHKVELLSHVYDFQRVDCVMQKSDGNLVVVSTNKEWERKLMEIDASGRILRQYQPPVDGVSILWLTDNYDRILMRAALSPTQLFDCEFNPMEFAGLPLDEHEYFGHLRLFDSERLPYNRTRNEIVDVVYGGKFENGVLTFFRLT